MLTLCHNYFRVSSNNKNNKNGVQHNSKRKFIFGIFLLLLVVVLWVASSEFTKYLYVEKKFERPFLITYVRCSLLFVYLLVICFSPPTKDPCRPVDYTQLLEPTAETDDDNFEATSSLGDSTFVPVRAGETTDSDDAAPRAVRFNKVAEVRVMSASMAGEALLARLSWAASVRASEYAQRRAAAAATRRHLRLALIFFFPWFVSNYLYRLSLLHSGVSAASLYVSACGALALCAGAVCGAHAQRLAYSQLAACLCTAAALVVLAVTQVQHSNWTGVLSALGSALCYAIHLLMLRRELRKGEGINSPLFVGVVGCLCGCVGWVPGCVLALTGVERWELPSPRLLSWVIAEGVLSPLLVESLWLWGQSLTSPRIATGMLGLCLPLSVLVGVVRGADGDGLATAAAAALGTAGWLLPLRTFSLRRPSDLDEQSQALMSEEPT